jgi:hypothetical protein
MLSIYLVYTNYILTITFLYVYYLIKQATGLGNGAQFYRPVSPRSCHGRISGYVSFSAASRVFAIRFSFTDRFLNRSRHHCLCTSIILLTMKKPVQSFKLSHVQIRYYAIRTCMTLLISLARLLWGPESLEWLSYARSVP